MIRLKILGCGTSTGVPIPACPCPVCLSDNPRNQRSRASVLITSPKSQILIDSGPDLRAQALRWQIRHLTAVLYTHAHSDHILGMDDLRGFNFASKAPLPCFATVSTMAGLKKVFHYIFDPPRDYQGGALPRLLFNEITEWQPFTLGDLPIHPFPLLHGDNPVSGFRIGDLAYATDCNAIPPTALPILNGTKTIIIDGLRFSPPHPTHFTISEAIHAAEALGAKRIILTHLCHSIDYAKASAQLPAHVELAWDGMEVEISA